MISVWVFSLSQAFLGGSTRCTTIILKQCINVILSLDGFYGSAQQIYWDFGL